MVPEKLRAKILSLGTSYVSKGISEVIKSQSKVGTSRDISTP